MAATTVTLNLFGAERVVEFDAHEYSFSSGDVAHIGGFVGTIGGGSARYGTSLTLWRVTDEKPAHRGNTVVEAADGTRWEFNLGCVIRNRNNARIVGWADVAGTTNDHDQTRRTS